MSKQVFTKVIRGAHQWVKAGRGGPGKSDRRARARKARGLGIADVLLPADVLCPDGAGSEDGRRPAAPSGARPRVAQPDSLGRTLAAVPGRRAGCRGGVDAGHRGPRGAADRQRLPDAARLARIYLRHDHARAGHPTGRRAHAGVRPDSRAGAHRPRSRWISCGNCKSGAF